MVLDFWMQENPCDFPEQRIATVSNSLVLKVFHALKPQELYVLDGRQKLKVSEVCGFLKLLDIIIYQKIDAPPRLERRGLFGARFLDAGKSL